MADWERVLVTERSQEGQGGDRIHLTQHSQQAFHTLTLRILLKGPLRERDV